MMVLKQHSVLVILVCIGLASSVPRTVQCADQKIMATVATLPGLSRALVNVTPLSNSSMIPAVATPDVGQLVTTSFPDALVASYGAPLAVSTLASYMKNPYLLLVVSEGVAITYLLLGQQAMPSQAAQTYIESFNKGMALSALTGTVSALSKATSTSLVASSYAAYAKPLVLGGSLVGAATAYFSPELSDDQKAVSYAALVAACMPVVETMCASALQTLMPAESKMVTRKIKEEKGAREQVRSGVQTKERVGTIAIALIALGGIVTTVQAYQEGTLSADAQLMAGITLSTAVGIARESVLYEYGYRAAQKSVDVGSKIVTHVIAQPVKQYGQQLIEGVFNAFGWR